MDNQLEQLPNTPTEQTPLQTNPAPKPIKKIPWVAIAIILSIIVASGACAAIILLNNKPTTPVQEENGNLDYSKYAIEYGLGDIKDAGFLATTRDDPSKYEVFNDYSHFQDCYNSIDQWAEELINTNSERVQETINESLERGTHYSDPEQYKQKLIDDYKIIVDHSVEEIKKGFTEGEYSEEFFNNNTLILVDYVVFGKVLHEMDLDDITINNNELDLQFNASSGGVVANVDGKLFFITIPKQFINSSTNINININSKNTSTPGVSYKPIIYLYPTATTDISVKLLNAEKITHSYPNYNKGWNVTAQPNGDLVDKSTGKKLYALYYENNNTVNFKIEKDGFVIKGSDTAKFLEEKLATLGLNERETEEFIIYWLPQLENNKYNYIRFATTDEINENMPLEISPRPDTIIRILMTFKELDSPIDVQEQVLSTPDRTGFTVVEWGGSKL